MTDSPDNPYTFYDEWLPEELDDNLVDPTDLEQNRVDNIESDEYDWNYEIKKEEEAIEKAIENEKRAQRGKDVEWYYDDSDYYAYILINCKESTLNIIKRWLKNKHKIICIYSGSSHRPANNRIQYKWFLRVVDNSTRQPRKPKIEILRTFFNHDFPLSIETDFQEELYIEGLEKSFSYISRENQNLSTSLQKALNDKELQFQRSIELEKHINELQAQTTDALVQAEEEHRRLIESNRFNRTETDRLKEELKQRFIDNNKVTEYEQETLKSQKELEEHQEFIEELIKEENEKTVERQKELDKQKLENTNLKNKIGELQFELAQSKQTEEVQEFYHQERSPDTPLREIVTLVFPDFCFLFGSLDVLKHELREPKHIIRLLRNLDRDPSTLRADKSIADSNGFLEKHFSTGDDDQGRLYFKRSKSSEYSYNILISHKRSQKQDIRKLKKFVEPL